MASALGNGLYPEQVISDDHYVQFNSVDLAETINHHSKRLFPDFWIQVGKISKMHSKTGFLALVHEILMNSYHFDGELSPSAVADVLFFVDSLNKWSDTLPNRELDNVENELQKFYETEQLQFVFSFLFQPLMRLLIDIGMLLAWVC